MDFINLILGRMDKFVIALILLFFIDFFMTSLEYWYRQKNIEIKQKIISKIYILIVVILANILDIIIGENMSIRNGVICFFVGNEGLNILRFSTDLDIPLPHILTKILRSLKNKCK